MRQQRTKSLESFGKLLSKILQERHISRDEFADGIGVSRTSVYNYVRGDTFPTLDVAMKIADYFGVTLAELVGEESQHSTEECYRRVGDALKASQLFHVSKREQQIQALKIVREMMDASTEDGADSIRESLQKIKIPNNK